MDKNSNTRFERCNIARSDIWPRNSESSQPVPEQSRVHFENSKVPEFQGTPLDQWLAERLGGVSSRVRCNGNPDGDPSISEVTISPKFLKEIDAKSIRSTAFTLPAPIDATEWLNARSSPQCIVDNYFYADVGVFIAPGGTGKTTLVLFMAIHIALGLPLFGHAVVSPGPVVILTAEDSREMLVARMRHIASDLQLTPTQIEHIRSFVRVSDVSGGTFKLTTVKRDVVECSINVERLIVGLNELQPVMVFIDPAVSFGVGESRVNDAEQGLVEAARKIRNALKCGVIYVHHTGKQNARDKAGDQYAGRGGSAFADGSRMVQVLQSMDSKEWHAATGNELSAGEAAFRLGRPKLSYTTRQPDLYLRRIGFAFVRHEYNSCKNSVVKANADKVWKLLDTEIQAGRFPSQRSIEAMDVGLTQKAVREAIAWLKSEQRVDERAVPLGGRGGARFYLHAIVLDRTE